MRQRRWLKLVKDYDCEILYHPGKANKVLMHLVGSRLPPSCQFKHYHNCFNKIFSILECSLLRENFPHQPLSLQFLVKLMKLKGSILV